MRTEQMISSASSGPSFHTDLAVPGATRTEIWGKAGVDVAGMPADRLMDADEMVDAALAGLDMGEAVTIPSLPDLNEWIVIGSIVVPHGSLKFNNRDGRIRRLFPSGVGTRLIKHQQIWFLLA